MATGKATQLVVSQDTTLHPEEGTPTGLYAMRLVPRTSPRQTRSAEDMPSRNRMEWFDLVLEYREMGGD